MPVLPAVSTMIAVRDQTLLPRIHAVMYNYYSTVHLDTATKLHTVILIYMANEHVAAIFEISVQFGG